MIPSNKRGLLTWLLERYVRLKVKSAFRGLWVRGPLVSSEGGLIVYANHTSFWDGFIVHQVGQLARWDGYAMMEEANLARYRFHSRIGAFGVPRDGSSPLSSLRYARSLLARPNGAVVVFPEGRLHPGHGAVGPLERGVELLAKVSGARCVPLAIRYCFLEHERPDVLMEFGTPHRATTLDDFSARLSSTVLGLADLRSTEGFTLALEGRRGVQQRWDAVRGVAR